MFENVIGQTKVIKELSHSIETDTLPGSILFCGERYSGKLTTALELARIVSCTGNKSWSCNCHSCLNHRLLIYPYLQILGNTSFMEEINLCAEIFKKSKAVFARYMFIRSVRKLLKRYDPILWDGSENKYKQAVGSAEKAEDLLREIHPESVSINDNVKLEKIVDKIVNESSKVADSLSSDNIPINQIRRISSWVHTASTSKKIILFENADSMNESSRNSLLKLLEEPPVNCVFILLTRHRGAIIPTILSRVRLFHFHDRGIEENSLLIKKVFRENPDSYRSVKDFFVSKKINTDNIKNLALLFINALRRSDNDSKSLDELGDFKYLYKDKHFFAAFIEECLQILGEELKNGLNHEFVFNLNKLFSEAQNRYNSYNQSTQLVLESLYYQAIRMKQ